MALQKRNPISAHTAGLGFKAKPETPHLIEAQYLPHATKPESTEDVDTHRASRTEKAASTSEAFGSSGHTETLKTSTPRRMRKKQDPAKVDAILNRLLSRVNEEEEEEVPGKSVRLFKVPVRVPEEDYAILVKLAEGNARDVPSIIRRAIERLMDQLEKGEAPRLRAKLRRQSQAFKDSIKAATRNSIGLRSVNVTLSKIERDELYRIATMSELSATAVLETLAFMLSEENFEALP